jgi:hypothetical protein
MSKPKTTTVSLCKTREYICWCAIKRRCFCKSSNGYHKYGGRGISMCKKWSDSFHEFLKDMGEKPSEGHSIERIDNDGNYEPSNCRWATAKEQANNRRSTRMILGKTLAQWQDETGISHTLIQQRIDRLGWSETDAVSTPANSTKRRPLRSPRKDKGKPRQIKNHKVVTP